MNCIQDEGWVQDYVPVVGHSQDLFAMICKVGHSAVGVSFRSLGDYGVDDVEHHHALEFVYAPHAAQEFRKRIHAVVGEQVFGYHREEGMPGYAFQRFYGLFITIWAYVFEFGKVCHSLGIISVQM